MRLNRNRLRNMILREMRSMNEQTYNPTVTVQINFSDYVFVVSGEGTEQPDYDTFSTIDEVIAFIKQNSGANIMYNIFPGMQEKMMLGGTGDQDFAIKELESAKARYGRMFSGR